MEKFWLILCLLNIVVISYGLWLCGHPFLLTRRSLVRRLLGTGLLIVGGVIMLVTADYPDTFVEYFLWYLLTLLGWLFGIAGWIGVGIRTKPPKEVG